MASQLPAACTSLPVVEAKGYKEKGNYEVLDGLKTYITGDTNAKTAIIYVYDIFGYAPQSVQGADIIAKELPALVIIPDVLDGGLPLNFSSMSEGEQKELRGKFFGEGGAGHAPKVIKQINDAGRAVREKFPSVEKVGAVGLCYGGKVVILAANQPDSPISASAQGHPSKLAKEDAEALRGPHLILASDGEPPEDVAAFDKVEKPKGSEVHTYHGMHHGWMGARAKLEEEKFLEGYQKAYGQIVDWLKKVLF